MRLKRVNCEEPPCDNFTMNRLYLEKRVITQRKITWPRKCEYGYNYKTTSQSAKEIYNKTNAHYTKN